MAKYVELICFQVSESYRGKKIRRVIFHLACEEAGKLEVEKLYLLGFLCEPCFP